MAALLTTFVHEDRVASLLEERSASSSTIYSSHVNTRDPTSFAATAADQDPCVEAEESSLAFREIVG